VIRAARSSGRLSSFGGIDVAQVCASVELCDRVEERSRTGIRSERSAEVVGEVVALRAFWFEHHLNGGSGVEVAVASPRWPKNEPALTPVVEWFEDAADVHPVIVPRTWQSILWPHAASGSNGTGTNTRRCSVTRDAVYRCRAMVRSLSRRGRSTTTSSCSCEIGDPEHGQGDGMLITAIATPANLRSDAHPGVR
jgi:hypothetical protein